MGKPPQSKQRYLVAIPVCGRRTLSGTTPIAATCQLQPNQRHGSQWQWHARYLGAEKSAITP